MKLPLRVNVSWVNSWSIHFVYIEGGNSVGGIEDASAAGCALLSDMQTSNEKEIKKIIAGLEGKREKWSKVSANGPPARPSVITPGDIWPFKKQFDANKKPPMACSGHAARR